ncbi:MAG: hypothetical protein IPH06_12840 [Alphaproteobacteria bacterium]|nr:hypothetical protein [Alphaproteobacteria bacterium]QQS56350.1 MAG: hypothetical protein IPN28_08595 [Alphaproteobacteria bacterium]
MKLPVLFATALVLFVGFAAQAEEGGAKTSYSKKKQGMVHFVEEQDQSSESSASESADASGSANPADIEPAASAEEETAEENNKVADMIKLPRK